MPRLARILPSRISGRVRAPRSKSHAIRLIFSSLLGSVEILDLPGSSDVEAALKAVKALGVLVSGNRLSRPERLGIVSDRVNLMGSATALRIFIPVAASVGGRILVDGDESLRRRPLDAIIRSLGEKGVVFSSTRLPLVMEGRVRDPEFTIDGWESSQYISGLIYAAHILGGGRVRIRPPVVSRSFINLTIETLEALGSEIRFRGLEIEVEPPKDLRGPFRARVEGDYALSSFYAASALLTGGRVLIEDLPPPRRYFGDHSILEIYREMGAVSLYRDGAWYAQASDSYKPVGVSVEDAPDLAPSIAPVASVTGGVTVIRGTERLRIKESDRAESIVSTLRSFGVEAWAGKGFLAIRGSEPSRGSVRCPNDHRIAMLAAALATRCGGDVENPGCVDKSNPGFWDDLRSLGGAVVFED